MIGGEHGGVPEVVVDGETGILVDPTIMKIYHELS